MTTNQDIDSALSRLIGDEALSAYKEHIRSSIRETQEFWDSVEKQSQQDLQGLMAFPSTKDGSPSICIMPLDGAGDGVHRPIAAVFSSAAISDLDEDGLQALKAALIAALARVDRALAAP